MTADPAPATPTPTTRGPATAHWRAARLGLVRGWIETKRMSLTPDNVAWQVILVVAFGTVLFFQRDATVEGQSLASLTLPSLLGMMIALSSATGTAGALAVEHEDGTLLRAKATPHGMIGYIVAKITAAALGIVTNVAVVLLIGVILIGDELALGAAGWLTFFAVLLLGMLAIMPWSAIIGSLVRSPNSASAFTMFPIGALVAISGIFYVITAFPGWIQGIAQAFPVYWLGHGMRAALLPDAAKAAEIGGAWRLWETVAILGAWAIVGLLAAPPVLRRMARRESGSAMQERRERAMRRFG